MTINVDDEMKVLQGLLLDLLVRSKIFLALETLMIGKHPDSVFINSVASDYLRTQISDLRKFFDPNKRNQSYSLESVIALIKDPSAKKRYDELKKQWETEYKDIADKVFFHKDKNYSAPSSKDRHDIERFIDDISELLDLVVRQLTTEGHNVSYLDRDRNGSYLMDVEADAIASYRLLGAP